MSGAIAYKKGADYSGIRQDGPAYIPSGYKPQPIGKPPVDKAVEPDVPIVKPQVKKPEPEE